MWSTLNIVKVNPCASEKKEPFLFRFSRADVFSLVQSEFTERRVRDVAGTLRAHVDAVHTRASDIRD